MKLRYVFKEYLIKAVLTLSSIFVIQVIVQKKFSVKKR